MCRADDNLRSHLLDVVASVKGGRLKVQWTYSHRFHDAATISAVASRCIEGLRGVLAFGADRSVLNPQPPDLLLARLNASDVDRLSNRFPLMTDLYPLTPMQQLVFSMDAVEPSSGFEQWEFILEGSVDARRLRCAWRHLVARHAILRTVFTPVGGASPHQIVLEHVELPWHEEDWREHTPLQQDQLMRSFLSSDRRKPFELDTPPLLRVALLRTGETTHRLILSTHQLLVDGWSLPRIFADLAASYSDGSGTARPACAYREYVKWLQQDDKAGEVFWRQLLNGVKEATPAPSVADVSGQERESPGEVIRSLTRRTTEAIRALGRRQQVDVGAIISAAWSVVVAHRSGRSDVVFGASFANRPSGIPGIETMVGPCADNLPIRTLVAAHEPIAAWLRAHHQLLSEMSRHQTTPLASLQKCSDIPAWSRMFDSLLVIQDDAVNSLASIIDGVRLGLVRWTGSTGYPATVMVRLSEEQLEIRVLGSGDDFGVVSAAAAADDLVSVLQHLAEVAGGTVGDLLSCLPPAFEGAASGSAEPRRRRGPRLAARTDMERALVRIWAELFGEEIGTDENYFKLDAHSLMIIRLHERIGSTIDAGLPISALFESPTIRALAAYLESRAVPVRRADKIRRYRPDLHADAERPRMEAGARGRRS
jgi:hypothetical protein